MGTDMEMDSGMGSDDLFIRQDDPGNLMWQLFRIWVEETEVPKEISDRIKRGIMQKSMPRA